MNLQATFYKIHKGMHFMDLEILDAYFTGILVIVFFLNEKYFR